jgi:hypothetical protein
MLMQDIPIPNADLDGNIKVLRVDFKAVIKNKDGSQKIILIELQKSKNPVDGVRFRTYLGNSYIKSEKENDGKTPAAFEIVTIYLLGYKDSEIPVSVLHVQRNYFDVIKGESLKISSNFVEKLVHECYVIQIPLLDIESRVELERILNIFNQVFVMDTKEPLIMRFLQKPDSHPLMIRMARRLREAASEDEVRRQMQEESLYELELEMQRMNKDLLDQTQIDLEKTQIDLEKTQVNLEKMQVNLEKTQVNLGKSQAELKIERQERKKTEVKLEETKVKLEKTEANLETTQLKVNQMATEMEQMKAMLQQLLKDKK